MSRDLPSLTSLNVNHPRRNYGECHQTRMAIADRITSSPPLFSRQPSSFILWAHQKLNDPQLNHPAHPTPPQLQPVAATSTPMVRCAGCRQPISGERERLCLNDGRSWHSDESCLVCCECGQWLLGGGEPSSLCYTRPDGRVFCPRDYFSLFEGQLPPRTVRSCRHCLQMVQATELVIRTPSDVFHCECFTCNQCGCPLKSGDPYLLQADGLPCCLADHNNLEHHHHHLYHQHHHHHQQQQHNNESRLPASFMASRPTTAQMFPFKFQQRRNRKRRGNLLDGFGRGGYSSVVDGFCLNAISARQKRMRTSFKHHQIRIMKVFFNTNHNPDAKDLKLLSEKTGLSKRVLQVWFQNARAKYRRGGSTNNNNNNSGTSNQHPCVSSFKSISSSPIHSTAVKVTTSPCQTPTTMLTHSLSGYCSSDGAEFETSSLSPLFSPQLQ